MPIQNEVLKMLASGTVAAGLYSRSPAGQLKGEIKQAELKYKNEADHSAQLQEQASLEPDKKTRNALFRQSTQQAYAASEDYYNLAQRINGSKQAQLLAKSHEAAQRAAGSAEFLSKQQKQLLLSRAAAMGQEEYADIRSYTVADKVVKKKPEAEEKK